MRGKRNKRKRWGGGGGGCHRDASYYITADFSSENDFHVRFHNNNNKI